MYKLMIVDDEQIEREGMAQFIPWEKYDIELCGTAWNGVDALEQIQKTEPDLILTDIKMPIMNGIELIEKLSDSYKDIVIIVLSGYGEYEYTSQAMEYGVKYYILKPCDEEKIVSVLEKAKKDLALQREKNRTEKEYRKIQREVLPHAKEELLRRFLLDQRLNNEELHLLKRDLPLLNNEIRLLAMKNKRVGFEYLEQFILGNILGEILNMEKMPLFTSIDDTVFFIIKAASETELKDAVKRTMMEFSKMKSTKISSAASLEGKLEQLRELYEQIINLYALQESSEIKDYLSYSEQLADAENTSSYFDFERILKSDRYDQVLFEVTLALKKMQSKMLPEERKQQICQIFIQTWKNCVDKENDTVISLETASSDSDRITLISSWLTSSANFFQNAKDQERIQNILKIIYSNLESNGLTLQYMAKNILYMNEDYLGRIFVKAMNLKFSSYLENSRIEMAKRLMAYDPDMKIAILTELIGYPVDGQYFSKAFRKVCGKTPTEYREQLKSKL